MNGFTNTFLKPNWLVVLCIFIYAAKRKGRNVMGPMINEETFRLGIKHPIRYFLETYQLLHLLLESSDYINNKRAKVINDKIRKIIL